jgi:hypothetical protein
MSSANLPNQGMVKRQVTDPEGDEIPSSPLSAGSFYGFQVVIATKKVGQV